VISAGDRDADEARSRLASLPGGAEALDRIAHLEASWGQRRPFARLSAPDKMTSPDADIIFAGGGLWLTLATYLARRGLRVIVLDRGLIGQGHREWNISGPELAPLTASGLFSPAEVEALLVARYDHGVCRWHGGGSWPVHGVLDHAVDGEAYLGALRRKAEEQGVRLLDRHAIEAIGTGAGGARVRARDASGGVVELSARLLVDALGSASPHAQVDLGCPTVGGVLGGLEAGDGPTQVNPRVGDILVTTEHREDNRQHIWEGFPGRDGDQTTYLFYYARAGALPRQPLLSLYGRFFRTLPRYKRGTPELKRLTYGIIPGWSRLGPSAGAPAPGLLLVGDAAARHSPLTFCGFGSMVRTFVSIGDGIVRALAADDVSCERLERLAPDPALLRAVGALALLMAEPQGTTDPAATNRLLDAAFGSLHQGGDAFYGSLLRDEMGAWDFAVFLQRVSRLRPEVYRDVGRYLRPTELGRWVLSVARGAALGLPDKPPSGSPASCERPCAPGGKSLRSSASSARSERAKGLYGGGYPANAGGR
jgi:lycopene cyclase CruA